MVVLYLLIFVFKQKTAYEMRISDWSSDVCSSDLPIAPRERVQQRRFADVRTTGKSHFGNRWIRQELQIRRGFQKADRPGEQLARNFDLILVKAHLPAASFIAGWRL